MAQLQEPRSTPIVKRSASTPAPRRHKNTSESLVLFDILIGKSRLKGAAMQIHLDNIGGGECEARGKVVKKSS
jgi:hypothetical protein